MIYKQETVFNQEKKIN